MRLLIKTRKRNQGSTLVICMILILIAATALGTYLKICTTQTALTYRSQTWNASMAVVEAGIEEGMAHIAYNINNMNSQGWALSGGRYSKSNSLGSGYYIATISTNEPFNIISTGYYPIPGKNNKYIARKVQVTTAPAPRFLGAMASKGTISLNGNPGTIDSYDSRSTTTSTAGKYDITKHGDKADVYLASTGTSFDCGNGDIWGKAYTSPNITVTTGPNGGVGNYAWQNGGNHGIQAGAWINSANISIPDVSAPFTTAAPPAPGTVGGTAYNYVLANGNYMMPTLDQKAVVTGNAVVYVTGNINSSVLTIQAGASVKIYCGGATATFNTINNSAAQPAVALQYFGLPANTTFNPGGNWIGAIYAPNASFTLNGNVEASGCVVAKSITLKGNPAFHYDYAISTVTAPGECLITSWNEL